jgi:uncharacterized membrane protein AbrB (regulator of aidB expression)
MKLCLKNIISVLVIAAGGFILFNAAFLLAAFVNNASMRVIGMPQDASPHFLSRVSYLILVFLISLGIFKSKLNTLFKATFLTMPLMVGLVLYQQSKFLITLIGVLIVSGVFFCLYKKRLPWQYYFATLYVAALGLCIMLFNIQI